MKELAAKSGFELVNVGVEQMDAFMKDKGFYATSHYNLFDEAEAYPEREAILMFERVACMAAREYLAHALDRGGQLVCAGTPEAVAECKASHTGKFLKQILKRHEQWGEASA